jgi:hypothetical protein
VELLGEDVDWRYVFLGNFCEMIFAEFLHSGSLCCRLCICKSKERICYIKEPFLIKSINQAQLRPCFRSKYTAYDHNSLPVRIVVNHISRVYLIATGYVCGDKKCFTGY